MKITSLLTTALAASAILFTACDKKEGGSTSGGGSSSSGGGSTSGGGGATSEKAALETYKTEALAIKTWSEGQKADASNPVAGMALLGQMADKMKGMKTAGLPADLKSAHEKMVGVVQKMADAVKDFPKDAEGFQKFMIEKATADPAFGTKFQEQMQTLGKDMEAAGEELKAAGKKYNIDLDMKG